MGVNSLTSAGLTITAVLTLLLMPAPQLLPGFTGETPEALKLPNAKTCVESVDEGTSADIILTLALLMFAGFTYLAEWVQRKLAEHRLNSLNEHLNKCAQRLRAWDSQEAQLEAMLLMVRNATSEYNLLLYLLVRQHSAPARDRLLGAVDDLALLKPQFTMNNSCA